jgi:ATP-binding cassette subfamily C protein CydC
VSATLLRTAQPPLRRSAPGIALGALSALSGVALLGASAFLVTRAAEQPPILYLTMVMVGVRAFALARAVFRYLERLSSHDASFRQLAVVRTELYRRLVRLAPAGLARTDRGDLLSRMVVDVDALQDLPLRVVQPLVVSGLTSVVAVAGVAAFSPRAALVLAVGLVVGFVVGCVAADLLARRGEADLAARRGALSGAVLDTVQRLDVLTAFGALDAQLDRVAELDADLRRAARRRAGTTGLVAAVLSAVSGATVVASIAVVAPDVAAGLLDGPSAALVVLVPIAVFEVVGAVPTAVVAWRRVRASGDRLEEAAPVVAPRGVVVDRPGAVAAVHVDSVDAQAVGLPGSALELRGVSARWPGAEAPALVDATIVVQAGDRIVVEGPSGAGKSTLAAVLARFLEHEGDYLVGGVDVHALPSACVRETVGLIEQSPWIFDESLRQNLLFARDTATDADLEAVLERVDLGGWARTRGGLGSRLGERGALLSGGQAQRLALARALLRGFPVLVLDEPAAGLEPELAEQLVRDVLTTARDDGTTVLLISHVPVPDDLVTRRLRVVDGCVSEL